MPYIQRDQDGKIVGLFHGVQPGITTEFLPDDNAEVQAYLVTRPSLHDRLKAILLQLPDEVQAQFGEVAAAIDLAIQNGSPNVAKLELLALTLTAELEPVRTALITEINNG